MDFDLGDEGEGDAAVLTVTPARNAHLRGAADGTPGPSGAAGGAAAGAGRRDLTPERGLPGPATGGGAVGGAGAAGPLAMDLDPGLGPGPTPSTPVAAILRQPGLGLAGGANGQGQGGAGPSQRPPAQPAAPADGRVRMALPQELCQSLWGMIRQRREQLGLPLVPDEPMARAPAAEAVPAEPAAAGTGPGQGGGRAAGTAGGRGAGRGRGRGRKGMLPVGQAPVDADGAAAAGDVRLWGENPKNAFFKGLLT